MLCCVLLGLWHFIFLCAVAGGSSFSTALPILTICCWGICSSYPNSSEWVISLWVVSGLLGIEPPNTHKCQQVLCYWAKPSPYCISGSHFSNDHFTCLFVFTGSFAHVWTGLLELADVLLHVSPDQVCDLQISSSAFSCCWLPCGIALLLFNPVYWYFGCFW